jgi:hypothetical protein
MAEEALFVPGTKAEEFGTGSTYMYVEAEDTLHPNDDVFVDQFFVARKVKDDIAGVYIPPARAYVHVNKGQFGWVLLKGASHLTKELMKARATKKAESVIDTRTKVLTKTLKMNPNPAG